MTARTFPLLAAGTCLAVWPVWIWFVGGSLDRSNDSASLLAAATALIVVWRAPPAATVRWPLALPAALLAVYAGATAWGLPPASGALPAFAALAALASVWRLGRRLDAALLGLCMLALPLAASLQFYLGYPMRVLAGTLSVAMLRMSGIGVVREGAMLAWGDQLISIDAPCSGVKMLWAGMYLACALALSYRLTFLRTVAALLMACGVIVAANALRASALFYSESGLVRLPEWGHQATGVVCFAGAAFAVFYGVRRLAGARP